jgi:hypothetical protein
MKKNIWHSIEMMMWFKRFDKVDQRFNKIEDDISQIKMDMVEIKTMLRMKECCMIQDERHMKKAE